MAIFTRVSRLLTADLHAVIDRLEEPQAQLQQAVREMQQLTTQLEQEQQQDEAKLHSLADQQQKLTAQQATTHAELELCLDAAQDALARAVIRRLLQLDVLLEQTNANLKLIQAQQQNRADLIAEHHTQLETLTTQAQLLEGSLRNTPKTSSATDLTSTGITEAQIDIALLAHQQRRAQS
jgi:phage shock protein A